jgi:hypothetical protein
MTVVLMEDMMIKMKNNNYKINHPILKKYVMMNDNLGDKD